MKTPASQDSPAICNIDISLQSSKWSNVANIEDLANSTLSLAIDEFFPPQTQTEISIVLADDPFIQNLNKTYRGKDKPTNVLSFPMTEPEDFQKDMPLLSLGDIIISYETMEKEAIEQNKTFNSHFQHMLVHGFLHLLHYDHETDEEAEEMETLEIQILELLNVKNPYEID